MIWKNRKLSFILALPLALVFASLFFSSSSYATSQSYSCSTLSCFNQQIKIEHTAQSVGFNFSYLSVEIQSDKLDSSINVGTVHIGNSTTNLFCPKDSNGYLHCIYHLTDSYYKNNTSWGGWMNNDTLPWSYTITFYDSDPVVPCTCPTCPEVPDNPYDDKLDNINKSILICGAIMIFIYFMFCIYQCFFGGLKK